MLVVSLYKIFFSEAVIQHVYGGRLFYVAPFFFIMVEM